MNETKTIHPKRVMNRFYFWIGLLILMLNKIRHEIQGYRRPRPFPVSESNKAVDYDLDVVKNYLEVLDGYTNQSEFIKNKKVLELGPGADLGVGLALLSHGVDQYFALDINELVWNAPKELYDAMLERLPQDQTEQLRAQIQKTIDRNEDRLHYVYDPKFDISKFKHDQLDVIVSHAAFEHFDDVSKVVKQLSEIAKPGTVLISEIDLQTHTRWIRKTDPLNIYRYSDRVYNLFKFLGSPNRVRPHQYKRLFEENGWKDVQIKPIVQLDEEYTTKVRQSLQPVYKQDPNLGVLSFVLTATK